MFHDDSSFGHMTLENGEMQTEVPNVIPLYHFKCSSNNKKADQHMGELSTMLDFETPRPLNETFARIRYLSNIINTTIVICTGSSVLSKKTVHVCTLYVRCMYAACTLHVRCMYAACTLHVRCMYAACTLHVRCMYVYVIC